MSVNDREEYEGDLLTQGNALNAAIKTYLGANRHSAEALEGYKTDILGYLVDISDEEFEEPRPDRLTKAGIEEDLNVHLDLINGLLSRGVGKQSRSRKQSRSNKRRNSRSRRNRRNRSNKRRNRSKKRNNKRRRSRRQ